VLTKGNYLRKEDNDEFLVLYIKRIKILISQKERNKRILEVIVIFKKETSSFSDFNLNAIINDLEKEHLLKSSSKKE